MILAQYFVEFIFYSFLGWVWESIYCTIRLKHWQDRGFLFGPVCPIYGSCVVAAEIVFSKIPFLRSGDLPVWMIFLICMIGSAIAEFATSWVMEKRFHARWWDYSHMPFNVQGRICLPVSIGFGAAGVIVVLFLIPFVEGMHQTIPGIIYEVFMFIFALLFGADFALTEASLSSLLKEMADYREELNRRAEQTYIKISSTPKVIGENLEAAKEKVSDNLETAKEKVNDNLETAKEKVSDNLEAAKEALQDKSEHFRELTEIYLSRMDFNQKRILGNMTSVHREDEKKINGHTPLEMLKKAAQRGKKKK